MADSLTPFIDNRLLRTAIIQFNYCPAQYMHASWLKDRTHGHLILTLRNNPRCHRPLSEYILTTITPSQGFDFDFSQLSSRLLLLNSKTLQQLVRITGIVVNAKSIGTIIQGKTIKAIKQALGDDLYTFSQGKARLLLAKPPIYALEPAVVGDKPWVIDKTPTTHAIQYHIDHCGLRIIGAALGTLSPILKERLAWKLPKDYAPWLTQSFSLAEDETQHASATKLLLKLARQVDVPDYVFH